MGVIDEGLYAGRQAVDALDSAVAAAAARVALDGRPSALAVRNAADAILQTTVELTRDALVQIGASPSVALVRSARTHVGGVQREAGVIIRAGERLGISGRQVRNDLADLLRGKDIDYQRYGLQRSDATTIRTVRSDAERLLADQVFGATHDAALGALASAKVDVADWVISPRHRVQDICDELAAGGPYPVNNFPDRPHALCGCMPKKRAGIVGRPIRVGPA